MCQQLHVSKSIGYLVESVREPYHFIYDVIAWRASREQFRRKFIPKHVTQQKKIEFERLTQGDLSVTDYIHEFTKLSRLVSCSVDFKFMHVNEFCDILSFDGIRLVRFMISSFLNV